MIKRELSVIWRANIKALVMRQFFIEWMNEVFGPSGKKYLQEKELPLTALLIVGSAPAHSLGSEDNLLEECSFLTVKILPLTQLPCSRLWTKQVISTFKKLCTKVLFQRCFKVTSDSQLTLIEFWKDHFNIFNCYSHG